MSSRPWKELDRRQRRREVITTVTAMVVTWVLLVGIYYLVPFANRTSGGSLVRLVLGIVAFAAVLAWQLRTVVDADIPGLRAVRALGAIVPVFLLVFAAVYLSLSEASTTHFSEPLDHSGALYLTITIFSTVGFGDITPEGDVVPFPRGPEGGHQIRNDGDATARVLIVSTNADPDVAEYPDTGKVAAIVEGRHRYHRVDSAVEHAGPE